MSELRTRRPTGKPSWPIVLLAGAEKAGKSWACAQASASDLIGRTLWIGLGEDDPDEYANVPGADFEIVEHDGTYRGFLTAVRAAVAEPRVDGKPNLIVWDSATRGWNLICDMAQDAANERARRKGKATDEADISMDLWNTATQRWVNIMDVLREHDGPVLITARLDEVTVMSGGKPTTDKMLKVQAQKSLPYDVGAVVEMPERGKTYLKGVRSARLQLAERTQIPGFTVDALWRNLGLDVEETAPRTHPQPQRSTQPTPDADDDPFGDARPMAAWQAAVAASSTLDELRGVWARYAKGLDNAAREALHHAMTARKAELEVALSGDDLDAGDAGPGEADDQAAHTVPVDDGDSASPATRTDLKHLSTALTNAGIKDRQDILDIVGGWIGRVITSRNELTHDEAIKATVAAGHLIEQDVAS